MVLKLEQILGSKNSIAVLRLLVLKPYLLFGLTEISEELNISKSNVLRVLKPLIEEKLVLEKQSRRKKVFRINGENRLVKELWEVFMAEKQSNILPEFKNAVDLFYSKAKEKTEVFVLFGSVAKGLATEKSDIDILVVGEKNFSGPVLEMPYRFEVHNYSWEDLKKKKDFVVLESLMNGIVYKGELFDLVKDLKVFPKHYLVYRLNKVKEFLEKKNGLKGKGKAYYQKLANITLGEVESLLSKKKILSKKEIKTEATFKKIKKIEEELAKEGENLWLA